MSAPARTVTEPAAPASEAPSTEPPPSQPRTRKSGASPRRRLVLMAALGAAVLGSAGYVFAHRGLESTDNAQIDAEVVLVPSRVAGTVAEVHFTENQHVKAGDLLVRLDDEQPKAKLAQAEANLVAALASADAASADARVASLNAVGNKSVADASLQTAALGASSARDQIAEAEASVASAGAAFQQATLDAERNQKLFDSGVIAKATMDAASTAKTIAESNHAAAKARLSTLKATAAQAQSRVSEAGARATQVGNVDSFVAQAEARARAADAQVATAKAARDLAQLELSYTRIVAPHDGVVSKKSVSVGQTVSLGQTVVQLVTQPVWVTANFKETQLERIHAGQRAEIAVDAYPGHHIEGEVESLSGATGSRFALLPPDNASGNFTKVVQRVPVRVRIPHPPTDLELRPGMSVELTVNTR